MSKLTTEEFIKRAYQIHGDKYNYSKVEYINTNTKVCIICPEHGEFWQSPKSHLKGFGCKKCGDKKRGEKCRSNKDIFIEKAIKVHGNKYDYSKVKYVNNHTKVCIICPEHGEFWQNPSNHLNGQGCPMCYGNNISNTETFIKHAKEIHNNRYDYSKVKYVNNHTKVCIICPEHGEFWQTPCHHLKGVGCSKCTKNYKLSTEEFIEKAKEIYGDRYDYSKVKYINNLTPVTIICPKHGEFEQAPKSFLKGFGCVKCRYVVDRDTFIQKAKKIHGDKYDYSKVKYINNLTPVTIICPKHGEFKQAPHDHLEGSGCPNCSHSISNAEYEICKLLEPLDYVQSNKTILDGKELDIYIPSKNIAIEYNGLRWHSEEFGKDKNYHLLKLDECNKKGVRLIQIFEDEWINRNKICKTKLLHICGLDQGEKIYGRKCSVKVIKDKQLIYNFLEQNHIQGKVGFTIGIGAYFNNNLISVMTFKKEKDEIWELNRFASDINFRCIGVGGKLFNYFINNFSFKEIKSFADRRWTIDIENNLYTKLGFKVDSLLKPSYTYYDPKTNKLMRIHKFNFRKQILHKKYGLPLTMTETEMAEKLQVTKIWDCGLIKYVYFDILSPLKG